MKLKIENLRYNVSIGLHDWEKVIKRTVLIGVEIITNHIIDVRDVRAFIDIVIDERFNYIEDLALSVKASIIKNMNPTECFVTITKIPICSFYSAYSIQL